MSRGARSAAEMLLGGLALALLWLVTPVAAQEPEVPTEAVDAAAADGLEPDEIDALVAPVVLYPDPLLTLILQASISPLDVVEADRFLRRYEKDPTLAPAEDWDESVIGLLNYPDLIGQMSEYLDWTQLLGTTIVDQTEQVQASIQTLRLAAVDRGILASNDAQKVVVTDGVVVIAPASKDSLSVPQYDPVDLLAALTPVDEAPPEDAAAGTTVVVNVEQPPATAPPPPAAAAEGAAAPPEAAAEVAAAPPAAAPTAAAPAYYGEPTYAAPPPPVSYAAPQSTFWSTAATFAGGAAVGGLLGYVWGDNNNDNDDGWDEVSDAIRDLDDNDWDDFVDHIDSNDFDRAVHNLEDRDWSDVRGGRDVNISDSTIVVGNDLKRNQLDAKLKSKRDLNGGASANRRSGAAGRDGGLQRTAAAQPIGLAPAKAGRERAPSGQTGTRSKSPEVKLPGAKQGSLGSAAGSRKAATRPAGQNRPQPANRAGNGTQGTKTALASGLGRPRDAQAASQRGAASKAKAQPQRREAPNAASASRGSKSPMGGIKNGASTKRDASRGKKSLGKSGSGKRRN